MSWGYFIDIVWNRGQNQMHVPLTNPRAYFSILIGDICERVCALWHRSFREVWGESNIISTKERRVSPQCGRGKNSNQLINHWVTCILYVLDHILDHIYTASLLQTCWLLLFLSSSPREIRREAEYLMIRSIVQYAWHWIVSYSLPITIV